MLLGNKEKTIQLYAENFLNGHITFDYGTLEDERLALAEASTNLAQEFLDWLDKKEKGDTSKEHKIKTEELYRHIIWWRVRGRMSGVIYDRELEEENIKLKDENMRLKLQNEELKKDTIDALKELRDKNSLIEQYEESQGIKKK